MRSLNRVELILAEKTVAPDWLAESPFVRSDNVKRNGHSVRRLIIAGGEAHFYRGGGVAIRLPHESCFHVVFKRDQVLSLQQQQRSLLLCRHCWRNSGEVLRSWPTRGFAGQEVKGRTSYEISCRLCQRRWHVRAV